MEWVETTAKSLEEALDLAASQLGVGAQELDYEVLEEPKAGLFGKMRSQARVRARLLPQDRAQGAGPKSRAPRGAAKTGAKAAPSKSRTKAVAEAPSEESSNTRTPRSQVAGERAPRPPLDALDSVPSEVDVAGQEFIKGLLEAFGLSGEIACSVVNGNMIEFTVEGRELGVLIGPKAQTLMALQELLRTVVYYRTGSNSGRILLDVGGYRLKRKAALAKFAIDVANEVVSSGVSKSMEPMSPSDRKAVHDAINDVKSVRSASQGLEPRRYVIIHPA